MSHRVLIVEDEADWVATYTDWLEPLGYELKSAGTVAEALALADLFKPHAALVDQRLEGPGGRDLGLSLIPQLAARSPATQILLVTAHAAPDAVERAFAEGARDYLEKTAILEPLLRKKLAAACLAAESAFGETDADVRESDLARSWHEAKTESQKQRKGAALERAVRLLLESIPGFHYARTNTSNETEEIDVLVTNRSTDELLRRQGDVIVVECKNWSTTVGTPVSDRLVQKVGKRYGRSKLGICVALGGFASSVRTDLLSERRGDILILLVDKQDTEAWIAAPDRGEWLVQRIQEAVVEGK